MFTKGGDDKKGQITATLEREKHKQVVIRDNPHYNDGIREDIRHRIAELYDDLTVRQESINLLNPLMVKSFWLTYLVKEGGCYPSHLFKS